MKINVELDLLNISPDIAGEILRDLVFKQDDGLFGCYSTFETRKGFEYISRKDHTVLKLYRYLLEYDPKYDDEPEFWGWMDEFLADINVVSNGTIICMWHWDGDGTLLFYLKDYNIGFLNTDCKKDYRWKEFSIKR